MVCRPTTQLYDCSRPESTNIEVFSVSEGQLVKVESQGLLAGQEIPLLVRNEQLEYEPYIVNGAQVVLSEDNPSLLVGTIGYYKLDVSGIVCPEEGTVSVTADNVAEENRIDPEVVALSICADDAARAILSACLTGGGGDGLPVGTENQVVKYDAAGNPIAGNVDIYSYGDVWEDADTAGSYVAFNSVDADGNVTGADAISVRQSPSPNSIPERTATGQIRAQNPLAPFDVVNLRSLETDIAADAVAIGICGSDAAQQTLFGCLVSGDEGNAIVTGPTDGKLYVSQDARGISTTATATDGFVNQPLTVEGDLFSDPSEPLVIPTSFDGVPAQGVVIVTLDVSGIHLVGNGQITLGVQLNVGGTWIQILGDTIENVGRAVDESNREGFKQTLVYPLDVWTGAFGQEVVVRIALGVTDVYGTGSSILGGTNAFVTVLAGPEYAGSIV